MPSSLPLTRNVGAGAASASAPSTGFATPEKATLVTRFVCPRSVASTLSLARSYTTTFLSFPPDAASCPLALTARQVRPGELALCSDGTTCASPSELAVAGVVYPWGAARLVLARRSPERRAASASTLAATSAGSAAADASGAGGAMSTSWPPGPLAAAGSVPSVLCTLASASRASSRSFISRAITRVLASFV